MSLYSILGVGASGLRAATVGVNVVSQNATNAATPGYTRREVLQSPLPGPPIGGNGVQSTGPARTIDRFVERRLLGATAAHAEADARVSSLGALDATFSEDGGLGSALDAFQSAIQALSSAPVDGPTRSQVLASAEALSTAFQRASSNLTQAVSDADGHVGDAVGTANGLVAQLDSLQQQIKKSELGGVEASDLRDTFDERLRELAKLVPVKVVESPKGINVMLDGGVGLVAAEGGHATLAAPVGPGGLRQVTATAGGQTLDVTSKITGGAIGGYLAARDRVLPAAQTKLDQLASDIATAYSAAHAAGAGLDGVTGRQLFTVPATVAGAAGAFSVSTDVAGYPDRLAAASDPSLPQGDNRNALALDALASRTVASGGTRTPGDALSDLVATSGEAVQTAQRDVEVLGAAKSQASALRSSVSGVSSDDEMVALTQYQRAYQASLKVVQAADDMLQELIAMKR